jgi:ketosteroid isomerase-like protein
MLRQDRFLLGILVGLAVLAAAAVVAVVVGSPQAAYVDEHTPDGVVHNYVLALQRGEVGRAYGYLADRSGRPSRSEFRASFAVTSAPTSRASFRIEEVTIDGDEAFVNLAVSTGYAGLLFLGEPRDYPVVARLARQDGEWRLLEMPSEWWDYSWYFEETWPYPGLAPQSAAPVD